MKLLEISWMFFILMGFKGLWLCEGPINRFSIGSVLVGHEKLRFSHVLLIRKSQPNDTRLFISTQSTFHYIFIAIELYLGMNNIWVKPSTERLHLRERLVEELWTSLFWSTSRNKIQSQLDTFPHLISFTCILMIMIKRIVGGKLKTIRNFCRVCTHGRERNPYKQFRPNTCCVPKFIIS